MVHLIARRFSKACTSGPRRQLTEFAARNACVLSSCPRGCPHEDAELRRVEAVPPQPAADLHGVLRDRTCDRAHVAAMFDEQRVQAIALDSLDGTRRL